MNDNFTISSDKSLVDVSVIHDFLTNRSYWAKGRTLEAVQKTINHSHCFVVLDGGRRTVGFARVVTDYTIFAHIMDVFILETHRSTGLGKRLVDYIINCPDLSEIKLWRLDTNDAHGLYEKYGFHRPTFPEKILERRPAQDGTPVPSAAPEA